MDRGNIMVEEQELTTLNTKGELPKNLNRSQLSFITQKTPEKFISEA